MECEAVGDGLFGGRRRQAWEGFAVEGVGGVGEVEVVGVSAAGYVDVCFGSGGGGVDAAGGDVMGGSLDGVAGEGVGVVDTDLGPSSTGAVVVEERPWQLDGADPVEGDGERVPLLVGLVGPDLDDGAEGAVADVGLMVTVWVEVAVGGAAVMRSPTENRRSPLATISSPSTSPLTWRSRWASRLSSRRVVLRWSTMGWS